MNEVYVANRKDISLISLEEGILDCLEDPLKRGLYFLPKELEDSLKLTCWEELLGPGWRYYHFASNFGFSMEYMLSSRILNPKGNEAYTIIQLSDRYAFDHIKISGRISTSFLVPNIPKIMDGGGYYIFNGSFKDVLEEINSRGYNFIEPQNEEFLSLWALKIRQEVRNQRKRLITDDFVRKVREDYFGNPTMTREDLINLLKSVDIPHIEKKTL